MQIKHKALPPINASGLKVGVVVSRFNEKITKNLLAAALLELKNNKVKQVDIRIVEVPGAMEIPYALQFLAKTKKYNCLVAIGCVIRGDTPHFDYVCKMAQEGALQVSLGNSIPMGFGILTVNTESQAESRVHVGSEAARAALELAKLKK